MSAEAIFAEIDALLVDNTAAATTASSAPVDIKKKKTQDVSLTLLAVVRVFWSSFFV